MSPADQYKTLENKITYSLRHRIRRALRSIGAFFRGIVNAGNQHFTIMLIPHSEKKIFNFKLSVFSIAFLGVLLGGILATFLLLSTRFSGVTNLLSSKSEHLEGAEAGLEAIRDELHDLSQAMDIFVSQLSETWETLGFQTEADQGRLQGEGDLSAFYAVQEQDEALLRELAEIRAVGDKMLASVDMLKDIGSVLQANRTLMSDLPTKWPVEGRIRITNGFGFREHPIEGITYLHKGIDIAKVPHAPIVAAANGKVIENKYDNQFGNFVVLQHTAGFYTKYAHMSNSLVKEGDWIRQGQQIGTIGKSGISTGYHLHFEIRLGNEVMDPLTFLRLRDSVSPAIAAKK